MIQNVTGEFGCSSLAFFLTPRQSTFDTPRVGRDAEARFYPLGQRTRAKRSVLPKDLFDIVHDIAGELVGSLGPSRLRQQTCKTIF